MSTFFSTGDYVTYLAGINRTPMPAIVVEDQDDSRYVTIRLTDPPAPYHAERMDVPADLVSPSEPEWFRDAVWNGPQGLLSSHTQTWGK
jgi:hypothetical protein